MISTVKQWNEQRGFGFIIDPAGGRDLFVHFTDILPLAGQKIKALQEGERVEFDIGQGTKGPKAINVRILAHEKCPERNG